VRFLTKVGGFDQTDTFLENVKKGQKPQKGVVLTKIGVFEVFEKNPKKVKKGQKGQKRPFLAKKP
jgi:nucleoid DNA-binding protein